MIGFHSDFSRRLLITTAGLALAATRTPARAAAASSGGSGPAPADTSEAVRRLFGSENRTLPTERRVVALTFNADWNTDGLDGVLTTLRRAKAPATFFLTGAFADREPQGARMMAAEHGIGNHSYSHPEFPGLTPQQAQDEVIRADRAIRRAIGRPSLPFFRFPFSDTTAQAIAAVNALGFADIEFSADTNGYLGTAGGMSVDQTVARAVDALGPGEIVEMHVGADQGRPNLDVQALPRIIDTVRARGYRIIDLRALLEPHPDF
ncbi:polysaccharide deacetylase family protein [Kitasatospora sp. GAS1066B]|uniref:polysaccharide deacetylase family protein n=1 Tax=Kitasatospora sp. GAS1066B TaxID=3156271 RepID=UPI003511F11D